MMIKTNPKMTTKIAVVAPPHAIDGENASVGIFARLQRAAARPGEYAAATYGQSIASAAPEIKQGIRAFAEKRSPKF